MQQGHIFAKGSIDQNWNIVSWDHCQFVSDSSTDRTRRYREARRTSQQVMVSGGSDRSRLLDRGKGGGETSGVCFVGGFADWRAVAGGYCERATCSTNSRGSMSTVSRSARSADETQSPFHASFHHCGLAVDVEAIIAYLHRQHVGFLMPTRWRTTPHYSIQVHLRTNANLASRRIELIAER
jgi:hypothetical protein